MTTEISSRGSFDGTQQRFDRARTLVGNWVNAEIPDAPYKYVAKNYLPMIEGGRFEELRGLSYKTAREMIGRDMSGGSHGLGLDLMLSSILL